MPDWDVNDHLEQDPANCQWNDRGEVMPDDALKNLPGSQDAPELGRSLTFNVYAREVRHYKRRNLQQAGARLVVVLRAHPELFVGVTLDPDTYMNPFFDETQWYDYNPGTLRQFREWLSGTGPYAGKPRDGAPDLSRYRRAQPLTPRRREPPRRAHVRALGRRRSAAQRFRATRRIRSGRTRGCTSGRRSAATSCTCTTTSCRSGWSRRAFRATASGPRRA